MRANRIITEALRHADSCHTTPSFMLHGTPTHNKWKHHNLSCLMDALQAPRCTHCLCSMRDPCKMLIREVSSSFRRARCFVVYVSWREYGSVGGTLWCVCEVSEGVAFCLLSASLHMQTSQLFSLVQLLQRCYRHHCSHAPWRHISLNTYSDSL